MKSSYKLALLAALGLASVTAAQAQSFYNDGTLNSPGDLIVGIVDPVSPNSANTLVTDLGSYTSLFNGETWNSSQLNLSSAFSATLSSSTQFGVVGDLFVDNGTHDQLYVTASGSTHPSGMGNSTWNTIDSALGQVQFGAVSAGSGSDWKSQANPQTAGSFAGSLGYSPNATGSAVANLYTITDNNGSPVLDGTFTLNDSTGTLTFNAVAVPEPTTYGLIAGAGLLIVSLRNKFSRKQA